MATPPLAHPSKHQLASTPSTIALYNRTAGRFIRLMRNLGVGMQASGGLLSYLLASYSEEHRKYHTLTHLACMFDKAEEWGWILTPSEELAIFYHDIVYEVGSSSNEADSAALLGELRPLVAGHPGVQAILVKASTIIQETARFLEPAVTQEAERVMDLDLSGLADPWQLFCIKNHLLQEEFGVSASTHCTTLKKFLEKPRIFHVRTETEEAARRNIERYLLQTHH